MCILDIYFTTKEMSESCRQIFLYLISVSIDLCLQMIPKVAEQPERYSLIALPEPFIVPGGRFREIYYWYVNLSTYIHNQYRIYDLPV